MPAHDKPLTGYWLAISNSLDETIAHNSMRMLSNNRVSYSLGGRFAVSGSSGHENKITISAPNVASIPLPVQGYSAKSDLQVSKGCM